MKTEFEKIFRVTGTIHIFPMDAPWKYLPIPPEKIPKVPTGGWGSIPVMVTLGKTTWRTSLFPIRKGDYFVPLKNSVLKKEGFFVGDKVSITYTVARR